MNELQLGTMFDAYMFVATKQTIKKCTLTGGPEADVLEPFSPLRKSLSVRPENLVL